MRLSHSAVRTYSECARKYQIHYIKKYRPKIQSAALLFGSAIDGSLNTLLETRDLEEANKQFNKIWRFQEVNGKGQYLPTYVDIAYAESDFDDDLIFDEDEEKIKEFATEHSYTLQPTVLLEYDFLQSKKKALGLKEMSFLERQMLNLLNWHCLKNKGLVMLKSYNKIVLPKIKEVKSVQRNITLDNGEGDIVVGVVDLVATLDDGKTYILDNKTSSREYTNETVITSQQLIIYHHALKEEYNLSGIGFIVLYKHINKNKKKKCTVCEFDGSGGKHKTCPNENAQGKRCGGEWHESILPKANIDILTASVPEAAEDLVLQAFDQAATAIKSEAFNPNLSACVQGSFRCAFFDVCWRNDESSIIKL